MTHKKIMKRCSDELEKDAKKYARESRGKKGVERKNKLRERGEAMSAAQDLKKRAKKAHDY